MSKNYLKLPLEMWRGENDEERKSSAKAFWNEWIKWIQMYQPVGMTPREARRWAEAKEAAAVLKAFKPTRDLGKEALKLLDDCKRKREEERKPPYAVVSGIYYTKFGRGRKVDFFVLSMILNLDSALRTYTVLRDGERHYFIRDWRNKLFGDWVSTDAIDECLRRHKDWSAGTDQYMKLVRQSHELLPSVIKDYYAHTLSDKEILAWLKEAGVSE